MLFTQDHRTYTTLIKNNFLEQSDLEIIVTCSGIGVSIFTTKNPKKETLYISLSDSPSTWEVNVGHKWKTLTLELASWIEERYKVNQKKCQLKDYIHIDFEKMFMLKPFFAELRRSYSPALYFQMRMSVTHQYYSCKIQSFQIDNREKVHTNDSIVFCSLPEQSIKISKPFIDFNIFKTVYNSCDVYKNIQLSFSDYYIHIDSELVTQVVNTFMEPKKFNKDPVADFWKDLSIIHIPITKLGKVCMYTHCH